ncbi:MAG: DUF3667 domain-containing protein [Flavobacteriaceae bacterium]|nr:DUF3667 domain-containing protein [Flavobacteriaceae bacterium]
MLDKLSVFLATILPSKEKSKNSLQFRGEKCLNCEQALNKTDRFCPNCSQLNSTKKLHFKDLFNEFFGSLFAYDSRIMLTLRVLLFKPGKISKDYIQGKRMRYANPFRFYLSVSIVFFLLSGLFNKISEYTNEYSADENKSVYSSGTSNVKTLNDPETAKIINEVFNKSQNIADSVELDLSNKYVPSEDVLKKYPVVYLTEKELDTLNRWERFGKRINIYSDFYLENKTLSTPKALTQIGHENNASNRWLYKKVIDFNFFKENPGVAYSYFVSKLPIVIFLFMPFFAFFIKLLYIRKNRFTYMEHLIFAFHVQSLLFVFLTISFILDYFLNTSLFTSLAMLVFLFYLYKAMRHFYEQGRFKTIVKFMILNTLFSILATFAAIGYALLSFSVY